MAKEILLALKRADGYLMLAVPLGWRTMSSSEQKKHIDEIKKNASKGKSDKVVKSIESHKLKFTVIEI